MLIRTSYVLTLYILCEVTARSFTEATAAVPGERKGHWLAGCTLGRLLSGSRASAARAQEIEGRKTHGTEFCSHPPPRQANPSIRVPFLSGPFPVQIPNPLPWLAPRRLAVEGEGHGLGQEGTAQVTCPGQSWHRPHHAAAVTTFTPLL